MSNQTTMTDWTEVRADYEAGELHVSELLEKHGIGQSTLYDRAQKEAWPRRNSPAASRAHLIGRLFTLLERQIAQLEIEMTNPSDKEAAVLGNLTRNLEKLIELDAKERTAPARARGQADIAALRKKLAKRIDYLKRV